VFVEGALELGAVLDGHKPRMQAPHCLALPSKALDHHLHPVLNFA